MANDQGEVERIAGDVVAHVRSGATSDEPLWARHFAPDFESVESDGTSYRGVDQVREKHAWWNSHHTVHGVEAEGPYVTPEGFAVIYQIDVEANDGSLPRSTMREVAVYTVEGGKVVREMFYASPRAR